MKMLRLLAAATFVVSPAVATPAGAAPLTFTQLTGNAGGTPAFTAVFRADLGATGLGTIQSITIVDSNSGFGGAGGQFSGFDLDAIAISTTNCADVACLGSATFLSVFDFVSGYFFTPGAQRPPADARLFGSTGTGNTIDNAVATLGVFDGNATTAVPPALPPNAFGFLSLGDGGLLSLNLLAAIAASGHYLYIGEVGNNGEVANSSITASDVRAVPEPGTLLLLGTGLLAARRMSRARRG